MPEDHLSEFSCHLSAPPLSLITLKTYLGSRLERAAAFPRFFKCCRRITFRAVRQQMAYTSFPLSVSSFRSFAATASIRGQCCLISFAHSASYSSVLRALSPSLPLAQEMHRLSDGDHSLRQSPSLLNSASATPPAMLITVSACQSRVLSSSETGLPKASCSDASAMGLR